MFLNRANPQLTNQHWRRDATRQDGDRNKLIFGNPGLGVLACPGTGDVLTARGANVVPGRSFRSVAILDKQLEDCGADSRQSGSAEVRQAHGRRRASRRVRDLGERLRREGCGQ
jgi:hypothetical protein